MGWTPRRRVVVPVDFSDDSFSAVDTALALVEDPAHLSVIHVLPHLSPAEPGVLWETVTDEMRAEHAREGLEERLAGPAYAGAGITVRFGDPGHVVTEHAKEIGADLIVMPSHGRTGVSRLLLGSVAERVLRLSHCPVLILKS